MFDKEQDVGGPGTVVGSNVKLNGILKDLNDITIHGTVDGEVISDKNVIVTETAVVKGPITAQIITVAGKINGTTTANKKLEITPTGKVYGSISTKDLVIRSGAIFIGKSVMIGHEKNEQSDTKKKSPSNPETKPKTKEEKETEKKPGGFWSKNKQNDKDKPEYELEK